MDAQHTSTGWTVFFLMHPPPPADGSKPETMSCGRLIPRARWRRGSIRRSPAVGPVGLWPDSVGHGQIRGRTVLWSLMFGSVRGEGRGMRSRESRLAVEVRVRPLTDIPTMSGQPSRRGLSRLGAFTQYRGSNSTIVA